jgi:hypothetical protein
MKITSGPFLNGLNPSDYYPEPRLAYLKAISAAGPFDVGNRADSSVQLYGVIPGPCAWSRSPKAARFFAPSNDPIRAAGGSRQPPQPAVEELLTPQT